MTMLAAGIHHRGHASRWSLLAWLCIAGVIGGQVALASKPLKASGVTLASVALLGLPIVVMLIGLRRDPAAMPARPPRVRPPPARPPPVQTAHPLRGEPAAAEKWTAAAPGCLGNDAASAHG